MGKTYAEIYGRVEEALEILNESCGQLYALEPKGEQVRKLNGIHGDLSEWFDAYVGEKG